MCCVLCVVSYDLVYYQRDTVTVSFPASSIRAGLQSNFFHRCSRCRHCPLRLCKPSSRPTRPTSTQRTHAVMPPLQDRLPEKSGVHTTASVFRGTSLISRLAHRGITFKVVSPLAEL